MHSLDDLLNMIATEAFEGPIGAGACFGYHGPADSREAKRAQQLCEQGLDEPVTVPPETEDPDVRTQ